MIDFARTPKLANLTPREREVLTHVASAKTNKEVAETIGGSPRTIEVHLDRIKIKLGARNRMHAAMIAIGHEIEAA